MCRERACRSHAPRSAPIPVVYSIKLLFRQIRNAWSALSGHRQSSQAHLFKRLQVFYTWSHTEQIRHRSQAFLVSAYG